MGWGARGAKACPDFLAQPTNRGVVMQKWAWECKNFAHTSHVQSLAPPLKVIYTPVTLEVDLQSVILKQIWMHVSVALTV